MYGYDEQDILSMMREDIQELLSSYGYYSEEQLIRIAELAGGIVENDSI